MHLVTVILVRCEELCSCSCRSINWCTLLRRVNWQYQHSKCIFSLRNSTPQFCCCNLSLSDVQIFVTPWTAAYQASLSFTISQSLLNSCPLSWWYYLTISSSVTTPFPFCLQSFPASGSFPMSRLLASGGQSIGASASATILAMNIQGWFPLRLTGLIVLQFKGLLIVFCNTTVWKHLLFGTQPSLWSNSHIHMWLLEKPQLWLYGPLSKSDVSGFKCIV